jgi:glycosyltransferase involved in cell wall biosynthesis
MSGENQKKVCVIFPALNEEETIGKVIDEVPVPDLKQLGYSVEVVVVDNGSSDNTREIAEAKGARVITEPNRGKGRAMQTAFKSVEADYVFMLDADFTYPSTYIPDTLELLEDKYDVVLGSRLKGNMEDGAMSRLNLVGNHLLALLANVLYRGGISDMCTGYWGFRGEVVKNLQIDAIGFELEANMLIEATKKGYRIGELPIHYRRRGTPSKLRAIKAGFRIARTLVRKRLS